MSGQSAGSAGAVGHTSMPIEPKVSTTQLGRYPIEAELGRGAMGVVYRSTHPRLEIPVAIKVLSDQYSSDPSFRQRFHREAATVAALNHPGIVRVYDFDEDGPVLFIVMEWVEGRSMRSWLDEYGRFSVDVSVDLVQQLLSAVGVAHDFGIVHRDLKPDNILISNRGKTKILDFGISKLIDDKHRLTATGSMVGTPAYMAPEQVKGEAVDKCSDVYSLGMILYELLHGEPPFTGPRRAVRHAQVFDRPRASTAIPSPIMEIIWKATAKDRSQRFQTCEEFSGAFHYMPKPAVAQPAAEAMSAEIAVPAQVASPQVAIPRRTDGPKPPGVCTFVDCGERRGWACAYRDLTGRECKTWSGRNDVAWERSWSALKSQGYLVRIAVRVTTAEPDMVQLLIGNTVVFKEVPNWISRRREGEPPDHADRARFGKKLFAAILEHVDAPRPVPSAVPSTAHQIEPPPPPEINRTLIEGMVLRIASSATRVTGFEVAEALALPFVAIEPILKALTGTNFLDALGLAQEQGPWLGRPLSERMAYAITKQGRTRSDQIADASTRYMGPAPVSMQEYKAVLAEAAKPGTLDLVKVSLALSGIELAPGVMEAVRAAVNSRSSIFVYGAPLQVKANGGVLLIDDLGRQRVSPKQILDRLLVPLEQDTDFLNLSASGRKVEIPFRAQLALSTNLKPAELLDEAYLRRLAYKVLMPDPTWEMWCRIFERERERLTIPPAPQALEMIQAMYGGRPTRGNHPRDLLERLVDVSSARGVRPQLTPELVEAAWNTLFVAS